MGCVQSNIKEGSRVQERKTQPQPQKNHGGLQKIKEPEHKKQGFHNQSQNIIKQSGSSQFKCDMKIKKETRDSTPPKMMLEPRKKVLNQLQQQDLQKKAFDNIRQSTNSRPRPVIKQMSKDKLDELEERTREQRNQNKFKFIYEEDIYGEQPEIERQIFDQNTCKGQLLYQATDQDFKSDKFHNYIGALLSYNPLSKGKEVKGTAVLIAPNLILTVAHNFYDKLNDTQNIDTKFYLGLNGKLSKCYEIESFFYPEEYEILQNAQCDFAIAKLKTRITQLKDANYLSIGFGFMDKSAQLSIFGYPADDNYKVIGKGGEREAFQRGLCRPQLRSIDKNIISYNISTMGGQSGCPIITGVDKNLIVGVHKAGAKERKELYNLGRYVNIDMILRMEIWRQTCNGDKFKAIDMISNKQLDLSAPLFREMKEMYKNELRKNIRLKKLFQHNVATKQEELQTLQKKIQSCGGFQGINALQIIKQNNTLKRSLKEKDFQLKTAAFSIIQVQKMNNQFKSQLKMYKNQLEKMTLDKQQKQNLISVLQQQIKKIDQAQKSTNAKEEPQPQPEILLPAHSPAFLIDWDPKSEYAHKFKIDNHRLSMRFDDSVYQINSLRPFPKNTKSTVSFKLLKYGGKQQICLGILCESRLNAQRSGRHKGSVGYFTRGQKNLGWINVDSKAKQKETVNFFIPEGGQMEMVVDLIKYELTFTNKTQGGKFCRIELEEIYRQEQVYAFCNMYCRNDMIQTVQ